MIAVSLKTQTLKPNVVFNCRSLMNFLGKGSKLFNIIVEEHYRIWIEFLKDDGVYRILTFFLYKESKNSVS